VDTIIGPNQGNEFKAISMAFWKRDSMWVTLSVSLMTRK